MPDDIDAAPGQPASLRAQDPSEAPGSLAALLDLGGKVALVTGGSQGLGLQIAHGLGEYGARVVLASRKQRDLDDAVAGLAARGIVAEAVQTDLSAPEAAAILAETVVKRTGRIDILVNNAGATWGAPAEDYTYEAWRKVLDLSLTAVFLLTQAVARAAFFPQGRGAVINVASVEGLMGHHPDRIGTVAYNAAKGGVVNMTRALAAEWGSRNIRVNAIAPGYFPSKMTTTVLAQHAAAIIRDTPLGKLGGAGDLMGPALLLASDAGAHMTGQILVVDGGATII